MRVARDGAFVTGKYEHAGMKRSSSSSTTNASEPQLLSSAWPKRAESDPSPREAKGEHDDSRVDQGATPRATGQHQCPEPECGRRFNRKYTLVEHMKTHTGEKPHVCPVRTCNKRFSTSGNLSRHKRLHGFIQPIECPVEGCICTFPSDNKLEKHMKFHLGSAVHVCQVGSCGKTFSTMGNLNRHMKNHHRDSQTAAIDANDDSEDIDDAGKQDEDEDDSDADGGTFASQLKAPARRPALATKRPVTQTTTTSSSSSTTDQLDVLASILHEEIDFVEPSVGGASAVPSATVAATVQHQEAKSDESDPESPNRKRRRTILDDMISFHVTHFGS